MTQEQYIIKKLNILDFAEQLGNISEACRKLGISRKHYYNIRKANEEHGVDGLLAKREISQGLEIESRKPENRHTAQTSAL